MFILNLTPINLTPISLTPINLTPINLTLMNLTPMNLTPINLTPINLTPINLTPMNLTPVTHHLLILIHIPLNQRLHQTTWISITLKLPLLTLPTLMKISFHPIITTLTLLLLITLFLQLLPQTPHTQLKSLTTPLTITNQHLRKGITGILTLHSTNLLPLHTIKQLLQQLLPLLPLLPLQLLRNHTSTPILRLPTMSTQELTRMNTNSIQDLPLISW